MIRRVSAVFALVATVVAGAAVSEARADVAPYVTCTRFDAATNALAVNFGYTNSGTTTVSIPFSDDNFFFPGPSTRGQPTTFLPGRHPYALHTTFVVTPSMPDLSWVLGGSIVTGEQDVNTFCQPLVWAGEWHAGTSYFASDVVTYNGGAWVAAEDPAQTEPGLGLAWQQLAAAGSKGDKGDKGDPGPPGATASATVGQFDRSGHVTIDDTSVNASSVVVIQYAEPSGRVALPSNVTSVGTGTFSAVGMPNAHFRYVVYEA